MHRGSLLLLLLISGCAATSTRQVPLTAVPTCASDKECEVKWSAARRWVLDHAAAKIQHYSPDYIETFNPRPYSPELAARVTKEPLGEHTYRIVVELWCNNMFGCSPPIERAEADFNLAVSSAYTPSESGSR